MNKIKILFFLFGTCLIYSCEPADSGPKSLINLVLVDNPAKWDSVLVEIEGVEVELLVGGRDSGSQNYYFEYKTGDKKIRVSDLIAGKGLIIGREELPTGKIIGISIKMGKNHTLYQEKKGYNMPLGDPNNVFVKLATEMDLQDGIAYDIILDLDLEKSIIQKSTSPLAFQLTPFFTVRSGATSGDLVGTISPLTLKPAIYLINGMDSISSYPNSSGRYLFKISPGTYSVYFDPKDSKFASATVTNLVVEEGKTTEVPTHIFKVKP